MNLAHRSFGWHKASARPSVKRASAPQAPDYFVSVCPEADPVTLFRKASKYNTVRVIEVPDHPLVDECIAELRGARVLVLDDAGNIHSIWRPDLPPDSHLTKSYWDFLATLPSISPAGTIGILGLAGGTIARMIHAHYPQCRMAGWELDEVVVAASRIHMGLAEIEDSGMLTCNIGDALAPESKVDGGFAGIMVDLFINGSLVPALTEESTWRVIQQRLTPGVGARVMVNLGQSPEGVGDREAHSDAASTVLALQAMAKVFNEISLLEIRNMDGEQTQNTVALTGPFEGLQQEWQANVPDKLHHLTSYTWEVYNKSPGED